MKLIINYLSQARFWLSLILIFGNIVSAKNDETKDNHLTVEFFANSIRRDPTPTEKRSIARMIVLDKKGQPAGLCAAFFVKNEKNRVFLATARHCTDYEFKEACSKKSFILQFAANPQNLGFCLRPIAGSPHDDLVIFEASFKNDISDQIEPLTLTYNSPLRKTRLRALGFPGDKYRNGKLTVTENCWINAISSAHPLHTENRRYLASVSADISALTLKANCSVYGGDSGGPILVEGTKYVIGLRGRSMWPNNYQIYSESYSTDIWSTDTFIRRNTEAIENHGIIVENIDTSLSI